MIANSAVNSRHRSRLARVLVVILGLLLAGGPSLPAVAAVATGHSATGHHAVVDRPTAPAPAHLAHIQPRPAGLDAGAATAPAAGSPCARGMHAAGHGGHAGCLCLHASCGGFAALFNNASPLGAIGAPRFIDTMHPGEPLPAHVYLPLRPPTQLNA